MNDFVPETGEYHAQQDLWRNNRPIPPCVTYEVRDDLNPRSGPRSLCLVGDNNWLASQLAFSRDINFRQINPAAPPRNYIEKR